MRPYTHLTGVVALVSWVVAVCGGVSAVPRAEEPIILPPIVQDGVEAALLIVPGAYINGQYYQSLGEAIQAASPLRLWVGLVRPFPLDLPNPIAVFPDMEATLQAMKDAGMNTTNVLISGHSLGGVVLQDEEWSHQNGVLGWIMLASYLPDGALPSVSLPVMHVSGELDGLTRMTDIHGRFKELLATLPGEPDAVFTKAVVILPEVNHMHFASGERPPLVAASDILSPLSMEDGQVLIAEQVSSFLTAVLLEPGEHLEAARATLLQSHQNTQTLLEPLDIMEAVTEGGGVSSGWTERGQVIMSALKDHTQLVVTDIVYDDLNAFGISKPHVDAQVDHANVTTSTHVYHSNLAVGTSAITPLEMAAKLKSREAIMEVLEPLGAEFGEETTCRDVNQAALDLALATASISARERYSSRGRKMSFLPDDVKLTGSAWLDTPLNYTDTEHGVEVTAVSLPTGVDVGLGLGGMHYCKLLTPSRALEYVMIDSLVGTDL